MGDSDQGTKSDRPALPRDAFRSQRLAPAAAGPTITPVVVTPDYGDIVQVAPCGAGNPSTVSPADGAAAMRPRRASGRRQGDAKRDRHSRNPFEAYGERSTSRPYALRLPDAIDLALRQIAAEERTHPLRIIDRALYEHLERTGRLPPAARAQDS
jgi:hypothetical protein